MNQPEDHEDECSDNHEDGLNQPEDHEDEGSDNHEDGLNKVCPDHSWQPTTYGKQYSANMYIKWFR